MCSSYITHGNHTLTYLLSRYNFWNRHSLRMGIRHLQEPRLPVYSFISCNVMDIFESIKEIFRVKLLRIRIMWSSSFLPATLYGSTHNSNRIFCLSNNAKQSDDENSCPVAMKYAFHICSHVIMLLHSNWFGDYFLSSSVKFVYWAERRQIQPYNSK